MIVVGLAALALAGAFGQDLGGKWQGTLTAGEVKLRLALEISKSADGLYLGTLDSIDQGARIPIDRIELTGDKVRLEINAVKGTYEGTLDATGTRLRGTWTQGQPLPLDFERGAAPPPTSAPPKPAATASADSGGGLPFDLRVAQPPAPMVGGGGTHLVWELHITNFAPVEFLLKRIDVLGDGAALASFEGTDLNAILSQPGVNKTDKRSLGPGQRAIAWLWVTLPEGTRPPASLRHRVAAGEAAVEGAETRLDATAAPVFGPPLKGGGWVALNGPGNGSIHRRAMLPVGGKATVAQRFAIDWLRVGDDGKNLSGDRKANKNYRAWGAEVLAVADATVAASKDGIPENVPGLTSRAVPITMETLGGNSLTLDLGGGRFAYYGHLQPGSLRVKPGDKVRRGQVIGLVGNSGNSTEPHLHFHVTNGAAGLTSEGVPYAFESFEEVNGSRPGPRRAEIPLQNARVRFPN